MQITRENDRLYIKGDRYALAFPQDRPFVVVEDAEGDVLMELFVPSSIHTLTGRDDTVERLGEWRIEETPGGCVASLEAKSSIWEAKTYRFRCRPNRFTYEMAVRGEGRLAEVHYFGGYYSGHVRWGSGFFWSGQRFKRGFNPEPNGQEINYFAPTGGSVIDMMGVPLPGKGDWYFTPPPFCFAFEGERGWVGLGVEAQPGHNRFTEYSYQAQFGFHLTLSYEGHTAVNGEYSLPAIGFDFADTEYGALAAHVRSLRETSLVPVPQPAEKPGWWTSPIFCGWGSQCYVASLAQDRAPHYARQELYERFIAELDRNGVTPGIVVLDDKWQAQYGENAVDEDKWPDLSAFIRRQHEEGKKVLLWLKAWDPEGLPAEECIRNAAGLPIAFDPTNPAFERRLRASVRLMLSADGYDADGFKIDFSARIPSGPGIRAYGDEWGLELMRRYLWILHDEAKRTKPDALVMSHTPHPYLADVVDMIRLNDINTGKDVIQAMTLRAKVAAIGCPEAIIDTDNWPITNRSDWRDYVRLQPELGVPSLYYVSHLDMTKEPLEPDDYALIRETWEAARKNGGVGRIAEAARRGTASTEATARPAEVDGDPGSGATMAEKGNGAWWA
ncbi:hypothetical protein [Paenibacillus sp. HJGM_3]|uniref:hypothetical protein n=1 Tax=Paenibacillus sp. HJGM_3 TaxID=3379816 RepID=UPI00385DCF44